MIEVGHAGVSQPTQVSAGGYFACGLRKSGNLACWGDNSFGETTPPSKPPTTPKLTWPRPTPIIYGTALSSNQLDATAVDGQGHAVAGTFAYNPPLGTFLHAASRRTLRAIFTPLDSRDYTSGGSVSTTIDVNAARLTIKADAQKVTQGNIMPALTWHANFVAGDIASSLTKQPACSTNATTDSTRHVTSLPGTYPITCSEAADPDYTFTYSPAVLTVVPPTLTVTLNASGPYGTTPNLANLVPNDPRISYFPASQAVRVMGSLSCQTRATDTSPARQYAITSCAGLSDSGYTVVYDYQNSGYTVTLAPVLLTFTGPPTLIVGTSPVESLKLTTLLGEPIPSRRVTITLGIKPRIVQHCAATTNADGEAACNIGKVPSYQRYRYITMSFGGDPHGARHDYAAGEARIKVLMKP
jgi:hypothetical protein